MDEAKLREDALKAQVLSFEKDNSTLKDQKKSVSWIKLNIYQGQMFFIHLILTLFLPAVTGCQKLARKARKTERGNKSLS